MKDIIDCHAHIFPDKIADKASKSIGAFYDLEVGYNGTTKALIKSGNSSGITKFAVQSVATSADQVESINHFILDEMNRHPGVIYGLGAMHPNLTFDECENALNFVKNNNLRGIKLHPDFQKFNIDDPDVFFIFDMIAEYKLPILLHLGDYRYDFSRPKRLFNLLKKLPNLIVIGAHFGGWMRWDEAMELLSGTDCFIDTSSTFEFVSLEKINQAINLFGEDRIMFGTDYPMWTAKKEIKYISQLNLNEPALEKILFKNASRVLNIT